MQQKDQQMTGNDTTLRPEVAQKETKLSQNAGKNAFWS